MHRFTIKRTERISPDTLLLTLQPKSQKDRFNFRPGQYAALGFTRNGRPSVMRCFSIVSSPTNQNELQFAMRIYGDFTHAIAELPVGVEVFVRGPFGNFVTSSTRARNLILMTGGIGVTPFMSMIRTATIQHSAVPTMLLYSVQSQHNIPFYDELLQLEQQNPNFRVFFFVTDGEVDTLTTKRVVQGRIALSHVRQLTGGYLSQYGYFICGPGGFMSAMKQMLSQNGVSAARIITEEFTPTSSLVAPVDALAPKRSAPFWTYGLTSVTMVMGVLFIMVLDLVTNVPKTVNAQAATATQITVPSATSSISTPSSNDASASSSYSSLPTTQTTTPSYTPSYQPTYQAPVTSVS